MAIKRIPANAIHAGQPYRDGEIITGTMVNEVVKVLKDGVNYNKFFIDAMFAGTTEEAIVIGVASLTGDPIVNDIAQLEDFITDEGITVANGDKAFIFRCIYDNEDDPTEITGVQALNYYKYVTDEWVHQYPVSMDYFIQGISNDFSVYTELTTLDDDDLFVVKDTSASLPKKITKLNLKETIGVNALNDKIDTKVAKADIADNVTTDDATKVLSAKQGKALQDTKEALANKKSVINDSETEYPNSKAVKDNLLLKVDKTLSNKQYAHRFIKSLGNRFSAYLPTSIQVMGDSTGNGENEWVYLFTQWLATNKPKYSVKYRLWNDTTQSFLFAKQLSVAENENGYIQISSSGGNFMYTSDKAKLDLSGDLEIVAHINCDSYTPTQTIVNKFGSAGQRGYSFSLDVNKLAFWWSSDGTANTYKTSTTTMPSTNGQDIWVRVVFDADNGASGNTIKFYTSTDGNTWTQLGLDVVTSGVATIFNNTQPLIIGSRGAAETLIGKIYEVYIKNELGETVCSPDFGMLMPYGTITLNDTEGNTWLTSGTVTRGGQPSLQIINSSQSGANVAYFTDGTRFPILTNVEANMYIVSLCHNQSNNIDYIPIYETLFDLIIAKYPKTALVCSTQNPQLPPEINIIPHAIRNNQITIYSAYKNYMLIDIYRAFIDYGDYSVLIADGVHPNNNGSILWKDEVVKNFIGII